LHGVPRFKISSLGLAFALLLSACATKKAEEELSRPEDLGSTDRVVYYQNELRSAPDNPELHYKLGNALLDMGRHQDAYSAYQQAIKLKPDYVDAFANLGLALRRLGNLKAATGAYVHALELNPNDVTTLNNLTVVAQLQEDWGRTAWCYERLVKLQPEDNEVLAGYADLLYGLGRVDEALPLYSILSARNSEPVRSQYRVGLCYFDLQRWTEAVEAWEAARILDPENASVNRGIAVALWEAGNIAGARQAVKRCQELGVTLDPEFLKELFGG
jgi:Flp pilus assembly protein TadD